MLGALQTHDKLPSLVNWKEKEADIIPILKGENENTEIAYLYRFWSGTYVLKPVTYFAW